MDTNEHIDKAKKNLNFLSLFFKKPDTNDWAVTVSFYAALHVVEAAIFKNKKVKFNGNEHQIVDSESLKRLITLGNVSTPPLFTNNSTHEVRKFIVIENFPAISGDYQMLYKDSFQARYYKYNIPTWQIELTVMQAVSSILVWAKNELKVDLPDPF